MAAEPASSEQLRRAPHAAPVSHPVLTVGRYDLRFVAHDVGRLPEWTGSAWRGAFGRALKQAVCVTGMKACAPCPVFERCLHARIFETPPPAGQGKMRKYTTAPRPYVLLPDPGGVIEAGQTLALELRLFGTANRDSAAVLRALEQTAWRGLGKRRLRLALQAPVDTALNTFDACPEGNRPNCAGTPVIELLTPLRLRIGGRYVGPADLTFGDFFSVLLRRLSMLCSFHEKRPFEVDFRALVEQARAVQWQHSDLSLHRLRRYSSRQHETIDMSGLTGTLQLDRKLAGQFLPWLWLGQHTLLGRGCVMGLGQYRLHFT